VFGEDLLILTSCLLRPMSKTVARLSLHRMTRQRQHCFGVSGGRCELVLTTAVKYESTISS